MLVFADGFEHDNTTNNTSTSGPGIFQKWTYGSGVSGFVTPGRYGYGTYVTMRNNNMATVLPASQTRVIFGLAFQQGGTNTGNNVIFFRDISGNVVGYMTYNAIAGTFSYLTNTSVVVATTTINAALVGTWNYLEGDITFATGSGSVSLYVNSVLSATVSGIQTTTSTNPVQLFGIGDTALQNPNFDDVYVLNPTAPNNSVFGEIKIVTIKPTGAGRVTQWTPTGLANNWQNVSQVPAVGDVDYNSDATVGDTDCYTLQTPSSITSVSGVVAVQMAVGARKDDSNPHTLSFGVGNGTTENYATTLGLSGTYTYYLRQMDTNPLTSAAWAVTDFATLQAAIKVNS